MILEYQFQCVKIFHNKVLFRELLQKEKKKKEESS